MNDQSPQEQLFHLVSGYWHTQAIYVAAKLRIADHLSDGPRTIEELAEATGAHTRSLYRLLRALASIEIFAEDSDGRFSLTPLAEPLRSNVESSQRSMAIMRGEWQYRAWGELLHSVQTGECAFEKAHGLPLFDFLSKNAGAGAVFDDAMTGIHGRETVAMLEAYDFSGIATLADIGGGNGSLISAVLQKYPNMKGILLDRPAVIDRARANIESARVMDRCELVAGDFFDSLPRGADAYLLRHIIHDWNDEQAITILKNCHQAMGDHARLLVVEFVIPPGNEPFFGKWFDLAMMVVPGGMERTEDEYRKLFDAAGFRLLRTVPTKLEVSVVEGEKLG
jgi:ubiquinone/menaquinone biosynthesis C-methylase UbiE